MNTRNLVNNYINCINIIIITYINKLFCTMTRVKVDTLAGINLTS